MRVGAGARLFGPTVLGADCVVEEGATVEGSVLWDRVRVGRNAQVHGAVLGSGVRVEPGATLLEGAAVASGERVPARSETS
ncbi:MAG: hypothetical protein HY688_03155 [Chloroflexi bacterium]|nr:hypothetical protein [Chloroflexota bacterium]